VLREAGLLRTSKTGIWAYYELEAEAKDLLDEAADLLAAKPARSPRG
jgi:DNA-binding transcriptional ArsR family regulator